VFYSFVLCSLYLAFVLVAANFKLSGASTDAGAKESGREEVHATQSPTSRESPADTETATPRDTSVLDIALVSGQAETINRDVVCGLLAECLQDVSSTMLVMPYLVVYYWVFNVSLFCTRMSN
jgi:hypothetical protein